MPTKRQIRADEIVVRLPKMYPDAHCELNHTNAFELLVATILSAQCTDERVNIVTADLFRKYPNAQDLSIAVQEELEEDVRSTGFFRNKAKNLRGAANRMCRRSVWRRGDKCCGSRR